MPNPFIPPGLEGVAAQFFGRAVDRIAQAAPDPLMRSVLQWVATVQANVITRWRPMVASGLRCALRPRTPTGFKECTEPAIGACGFCHKPTCLHHALIDEMANVLCHQCVAAAAKVMNVQPAPAATGAEPPPPPPRDRQDEREERVKRKAALRALDLDEPFTSDQLSQVFRRLMGEHHPDKARDEKDRVRRQARCSKITAAYHYLKEHPKSARSAA